MKKSEFEKLVDELISKINAIELSKADQIYNEIEAFKKLAHHSDNKFILEDIEKIKGDFRKTISKYDNKIWKSAIGDLALNVYELKMTRRFDDK